MTDTFQSLLVDADKKFTSAGIPSSVLDAQILLMTATGIMSKEKLICNIDHEAESSTVATFHALVKRRIQREPVAYIRGEKEFFGRSFAVNQNCLIPRPDTETLIETALEIIDGSNIKTLLDIGTGSGIIPITLLLERKNIKATAVDISISALETAKQNAKHFDVTSMIEFIESDIYSSVADKKFDMIASNPPYIAEHAKAELVPEITNHEPEIALFSGKNGLDHIKSIIAGAGEHLNDNGYLILETGHDQHRQIESILERSPCMQFIKSVKDLAGIDRVVVAKKV